MFLHYTKAFMQLIQLTYQPLLDKAMEMELRRRLHFDSLMIASQLLPGDITTNSCTPYLSITCGVDDTRITFPIFNISISLLKVYISLLHTI